MKLPFISRLKKKPQLSARSIYAGLYSLPKDPIINNRGVDEYLKMPRDPEVASDTALLFDMVMPGVQWKPADDSKEAARNAEFMTAAMDQMRGSQLSIIRDDIFGNAFKTGFSVVQPQYEIKNVPGFGMSVVFKSLDVKPSESFLDAVPSGIKTDDLGNILEFRQSKEYGGEVASPSDVLYYAYRGGPNNRYGKSGYHEIYDPYKRKSEIFKVYSVFMVSNASGIRSITVSEEEADDPSAMAAAQHAMQDLAPLQSFALDPRWKFDLQIPPGNAGMHFKVMINEQDMQIRKGLLGDSAFSGQADQGGAYASRKVSQSNTQRLFRGVGYAYAEDIGEQLSDKLLSANMMDGPRPLMIPEPISQNDGDPKEAIEALEKMGVLNRLPETTAVQLARAALAPLGIDVPELLPVPVQAPVAPGTEQKLLTAPKVSAEIWAKAPEGRTIADLKRRDRAFDKLIEDSKTDLVNTWGEVYPQTLDKLNAAVFNPDGNGWKVKSPEDIRKIIFNDSILRYKSSEVRKSMDASKVRGWEMGIAHAEEIVGVKAVSTVVTPKVVTNTMARSILKSRTMVEINSAYGAIEKEMYYLLENALTGGQSPQAVSAKMREVLATGGFAESQATTIVNTSLNWTYNESRMNLYRSLQDPTGKIPGSIKGYVFTAVLDKNTTKDICEPYNGQAFSADDPNLPQPPLHFNCRSQLIPVFWDEQPWTDQSGGQFISLDKSKSMSSSIMDGFGGVA